MLFAALLACLSQDVQVSPEALLAQKLKSPFLSKAPWILDYEKAREESGRTGKPVFAYFTRSFAPCPPCDDLEKGVFLTADFAKLADRYVLFCHITSQAQGEKHQGLLIQKGGQAWPYLIFMGSEGSVLGLHKGPLTAGGLAASGVKPQAFIDLKAKAEKGGPDVKIDLILSRLELGHFKPGEAEARIRESGGPPSDEQKKRLEVLTANAEVEAILTSVKSEAAKNAAAKRCYERRKAGKLAPTVEPWQGAYWNLVLEHAESVKDLEVFEESLKVLKEKYAALPDAQKYLKDKEASLKKLKGP